MMATLMMLAMAGCKHQHTQSENEHSHDESLQLTAYNNDFELFAEAAPFVAGKTGDILAHFTHLENFKPLTEGSVTVRLTVGRYEVHQTLEQSAQAGIYLFSLKPPAAGTGKLVFDIQSAKYVSQLVVPDIQVFISEHDADEAAAQVAVTSSNSAIFTKEQSCEADFDYLKQFKWTKV